MASYWSVSHVLVDDLVPDYKRHLGLCEDEMAGLAVLLLAIVLSLLSYYCLVIVLSDAAECMHWSVPSETAAEVVTSRFLGRSQEFLHVQLARQSREDSHGRPLLQVSALRQRLHDGQQPQTAHVHTHTGQ